MLQSWRGYKKISKYFQLEISTLKCQWKKWQLRGSEDQMWKTKKTFRSNGTSAAQTGGAAGELQQGVAGTGVSLLHRALRRKPYLRLQSNIWINQTCAVDR